MASRIHYQVNVCGGDFQHVRKCFRTWKEEPLVYRKDRRMFEDQNEVRILSGHTFDSTVTLPVNFVSANRVLIMPLPFAVRRTSFVQIASD